MGRIATPCHPSMRTSPTLILGTFLPSVTHSSFLSALQRLLQGPEGLGEDTSGEGKGCGTSSCSMEEANRTVWGWSQAFMAL